MRRREFISLLGSATVTWPFAVMAQQAGRTYRLGCWRASPRDSPIKVAFFEELRRGGFTEGQNLTVEYRAFGQHPDLIPQYAAEVVKARVDVIATAGDETVRVLQQTTKAIPIVAIVGDMLGSGLVTSLARPDGNTTGVSVLSYEADGKRQDILIEAVPGLRLMAVLADVNYTSAAKLEELQKAARAHSIEYSVHRVARAEELATALDSAQASGATALNVVSSALFYAHRHLIMDRAASAPGKPQGRQGRPGIIHSSVYLPEAVYEALRRVAFEERVKIHDIVLEGLNWRSGSGTAGGVEDFCYEGRLNTAFDNDSKAVDEDDRSSATAENANANSKAQP